jgi:hypothetical protein
MTGLLQLCFLLGCALLHRDWSKRPTAHKFTVFIRYVCSHPQALEYFVALMPCVACDAGASF